MPQILGSTMLDQQTFQRSGLPDPLKCSNLSNDNLIRENNTSDESSSTADQIKTDIYDSQQFWNNNTCSLDVAQVFQSLAISTNADVASNQSSSSAYSSSYSSPTSTSYGPGMGNSMQNSAMQNSSMQNNSMQNNSMQNNTMQNNSMQNNSMQNNTMQNNTLQNNSMQNNAISQLQNLPNQSRLNEWVSNPAINASSWATQNLSSPAINPPISRPIFNNGPSGPTPMAAFGNPSGWGNNNMAATQLAMNSNLQTYLMRSAFKNMSSSGGGRRGNSSFGGRDSSVIPSKVPTFVLTEEDIATVNTMSCKKDPNMQLYYQSMRKNLFVGGGNQVSKQSPVPRPLPFNNSSNRTNEASQENLNFLPASSATDHLTETMLYELLNQDNTEQTFHPSIQDSPIRKFHYDPPGEKYSRKVFVGGLPPDIDEREIHASFCHFGSLDVDWPHKSQSRAPFPPKGYAFLLFHEEYSVQALISMCKQEGGKYYYFVSSPTLKDKQNVGREFVQIRPWSLQDADFVMDGSQPLDPRKTIFVGGVPRPLRSVELAVIMNKYYSGVCYAGIDVDPELKYPKGAGRVAFSNHTSYINAINNRFIQLKIGDIDKKVEVKPYVLDDQLCDECKGEHCGGKFAPFFCGHISCLRYFCEHCWSVAHTQPGREFHKPLVKEGADRSRSLNSFRW